MNLSERLQKNYRKSKAADNPFGVEGVNFSMRDGIMIIDVETDYSSAQLTTHGASVLKFQQHGQQPILWMSPTAVYSGKKALRGGIPICWPWFGKASQDGLPAHGVVRNMAWHLKSVEQNAKGSVELCFSLKSSPKTLEIWPHAFALEYRVEVGETLGIQLITHNPNDYDLVITEALHTYFAVSDVNRVSVEGFSEAAESIDTLVQPNQRAPAEKSLAIQAPIDSVFENQTHDLKIIDPLWKRAILIETFHSRSAVVWNAGEEIVKGFADIPDDAWPGYLCVEAGNVWDNQITVPAQDKHTLSMSLSAKRL